MPLKGGKYFPTIFYRQVVSHICVSSQFFSVWWVIRTRRHSYESLLFECDVKSMISGGKKVNFEWTEWGPVQVSHGQVIGGPEWEHWRYLLQWWKMPVWRNCCRFRFIRHLMRDDSLQLGGKSGQKKFSPFLKPRDLDCSLHTLDDLPRQKDSIETDFQKRQTPSHLNFAISKTTVWSIWSGFNRKILRLALEH